MSQTMRELATEALEYVDDLWYVVVEGNWPFSGFVIGAPDIKDGVLILNEMIGLLPEEFRVIGEAHFFSDYDYVSIKSAKDFDYLTFPDEIGHKDD